MNTRLAACLVGFLFSVRTALPMSQSVMVSVYQGPCREGEFSANLEVARDAIRQARDHSSQFLVFPEGFLTGRGTAARAGLGARALNDADLRTFIAESSSHDLVILAGLVRREGSNLFNSVLVIQRGRMLGRYDKVMLTAPERNTPGFAAGRSPAVFQAHGVRFGVNLGADVLNPLCATAARLQGAEILFVPSPADLAESSISEGRTRLRALGVALATQFGFAVALAIPPETDSTGKAGDGGGLIVSPQGDALAGTGTSPTELLTASLTPSMFTRPDSRDGLEDAPAWMRASVAGLLTGFRPPVNEADLREWLTNMVVHHHYTSREVSAATGLSQQDVEHALHRLQLPGQASRDRDLDQDRDRDRPTSHPLRVLPFPGGRHPRQGFFDGAINPQRETKVSVFTPWQQGGYVVVDVPEAIFSNLGLTYLAHTHIPTIWDSRGIDLPRLEWTRHDDGRLTLERTLPNGIAFGTEVSPRADSVTFTLWLRNGTPDAITGLRVQNCVMLGAAAGFGAQALTNKVFTPPFAAARSESGTRWILTAWERCGRAWGNDLVPCIHADPVLPDCPPGQTVRVQGWLSFYEGSDVTNEIARLLAAGVVRTRRDAAP